MKAIDMIQWGRKHQRLILRLAVPLLLAMIVATAIMVYLTGGIKFVYSHSMYLPIVLAGLIFGVKGGLLFALLGGLALGPMMPIDVASGEMQQPINWLYRTAFFVLMGMLSGLASDAVRLYLRHLIWVSRHDSATRLPNRHALQEDLQQLQGMQVMPDMSLLVVLSLYRTTQIKAAFGYELIEQAIRQTASRFHEVLDSRARVYRTDSEAVSILLETVDATEVERIPELLSEAFRLPFSFENISVHIESKMGYLAFASSMDTPETWLRSAESALNTAYESPGDYVAYRPAINLVARENTLLLGELLNAVDQGQLALHYQPKVSMASGEVCGVEALMRWHHPLRGQISPGKFIPLAEQSTLIHPLTRFALEQGLQQIVKWREQGIAVPVAINVSAHNLTQPDFSGVILELLQTYGLPPACLEMEVTESGLMMDIERTVKELEKLAAAGITISVDDFGTGYSSLQYLHRLPISKIKIDQSFVRRLPDDASAQHIIEAAIGIAGKMDMQTIAEGIENRAAFDFLQQLGCDLAQGYLLSKPLSGQAFTQWYQQNGGLLQLEKLPPDAD